MTDFKTIFDIFLGALVGLLSSGLTELIMKEIAIIKLKRKIKFEIKANLNYLKENYDNDKISIIISSPLWDYILNSNIVVEMSFGNYMDLINMLNHIKIFNQCEEHIKKGEKQNKDLIVKWRQEMIEIMEKCKI